MQRNYILFIRYYLFYIIRMKNIKKDRIYMNMYYYRDFMYPFFFKYKLFHILIINLIINIYII